MRQQLCVGFAVLTIFASAAQPLRAEPTSVSRSSQTPPANSGSDPRALLAAVDPSVDRIETDTDSLGRTVIGIAHGYMGGVSLLLEDHGQLELLTTMSDAGSLSRPIW